MFKKIVIALFAITLITITAATIAVKVLVTEEKIIAAVVPPIEKALGREVKVSGAKAMVFPFLGVEVSGLAISNTTREGFRNDEPFIALEKFEVKIAVMPLLQKQVVIDKIVLIEPDILVEVDKDGSFNYEDLAVMPEPKDSADIEVVEEDTVASAPIDIAVAVNAIIVQDARVRYFDAKGGHSLVLGKINDRTDFNISGAMNNVSTTGELTITDIAITTGAVPTPLTDFTLTFNHDIDVDLAAEKVAINEITASLQKIGITLTGEVTEFNSDAKMDLSLNSDKIYIQEIINEIPRSLSPDIAKLSAEGYAALQLAIGGSASAPAVDGKIKVADGKISYSDLPQSINDISAAIAFTMNSLNIMNFDMKLGTNPISMALKVDDFANPMIDGKLDAKLLLDDLREMMALPDGFTVGGLIEAGITAKGKVDPTNPTALDIKGNVAVTDLRAKTVDITEPLIVDGTVSLSPVEIVQNVNIKIADSDISISGALKNYLSMVLPDRGGERTSLVVDVNSTMLNTNSFLSKPEPTTAEEAPAAVEEPVATEPKEPKPVLTMPLPDMELLIAGNVGTLIYDQITLTGAKGSISMKDQLLTIAANAGIYGGTTKFGMKMDANQLENVKINLGIDVDKVQINDLISSFNDQLDGSRPIDAQLKDMDGAINGAVTFNSAFTTNGYTDQDMTKNLTGTIHADVADGSINSGTILDAMSGVLTKFIDFNTIEFSTIDFDARIADEQLHIDTMKITSAKLGDWRGFGAIGFDNSLDMTIETRLTEPVSRPIVGVQQKGKDALSGLASKYLGGTGLEGSAQGLIDKNGVPVDADGRVTAIIGLGGTVAKPDPSFGGFKMYEGETSGSQEQSGGIKATVADVKEKVDEELARRKAQAEAELKAAEERARQEAEALAAKAEAERKAAEEKVRQEAAAAEERARQEAAEAQRKLEEEKAKLKNKAGSVRGKLGF